MQEKLNINELIKVDQLPHVFEQLEEIGKWVDNGLAQLDLDNLEITEENKQNLKKTRTEINSIHKLLEDKRKEIKDKILEPYKLFEEKYDNEVKNKLLTASEKLSTGINEIETKQKAEKEDTLRQFFENYKTDAHLEDIVSFEDVGLNITLSASEKSLKEQIVEFIKKVSDDFQAISSNENREEILMEYKNNGFNYSQAVNSVNAKLEEIKKLEIKLAQKEEIEAAENAVVQNVETLVSAPVEIKIEEAKPEEAITCQFTVTTTKEKIKLLKEFLQKENIKYE